MISYTREEILSASEVARSFSSVLKELMQHTKERFAVSKNNKIEAVVLSIDEYERLQEAYDLMEHMEIYKQVEARTSSKTISMNDAAKKYGIDLDAL